MALALPGRVCTCLTRAHRLSSSLPTRCCQVFLLAKSLICCSLLNAAGGLWVGLVAACSAALATCLVACVWQGRMDRLGKHRCCHMHSVRDWSLEGQREGSGDGAGSGSPPSPRLLHSQTAGKGSKKEQTAFLPSSPRIQTWTEDLAAASGGAASPRGAPLSPALKASAASISAAEVVAPLAAPRSMSLPARRPGAASPYHYRPLQPVLEPAEAGADSPGAGLAGSGDSGGGDDSQLSAEGSAPPLPAQGSMGARQAAAELSQHAFCLASRAQALLSDVQRAAGGGGGPQHAPARQSPPPKPLERQGSRIPRPYLNY